MPFCSQHQDHTCRRHAQVKALLPPRSEAVATGSLLKRKIKIQGDFISILGSGSKKGRSANVLAFFCVSIQQFQRTSQGSARPELTEAHQESPQQRCLAPVLHHEFYTGQIWKWTNIPLFSTFGKKKNLKSVMWILFYLTFRRKMNCQQMWRAVWSGFE